MPAPALRMNVTLRQLRVFCAVYEKRSFTAAAEEMHMTQSAASKLCAELESEIGLPLFDRTTRRVVPRDGAAELYAYAQDVLNTMRLAGRRLSALRSLEDGEVSMASSPMTMYGIISSVIARFKASHPRITLDLHELSTDETIEYVKTGRCDFGIVSTSAEDPQLSARVVYAHPLLLACSARHALGQRAEVTWEEVAQHEHIALRSVYSTRTTVDRILRAKGLALKSSIQAGTLATALKLSADNLGLTLIPRYAAAAAVERGLQVIQIQEAGESVHELSMLTRRGLKPSIAAAAFMAELEQELAGL